MNAARVLIGEPQSLRDGKPPFLNSQSGIDPNPEHPPLFKLFIAGAIYLLGDTEVGWRLPSIILGVGSILVFYLLLKRLNGNPTFWLLATFLFSFDNLAYVHSRIATLDIGMLFFSLLGVWLFLSQRFTLSGIALATASLNKTTAIFYVLALVSYHVIVSHINRHKTSRRQTLIKLLEFGLAYYITFMIMLYTLGRLFTPFDNPIQHLLFISLYTQSLQLTSPIAIQSNPWQWLFNEVKIPYLIVPNYTLSTEGLIQKVGIFFIGAMNPAIIFLALPTLGFSLYTTLKARNSFALLTTLLFAFNYIPYLLMVLSFNRITYLFYMLPTIPAMAMAISHTFGELKPGRVLTIIYIIAVLVGFATTFPFQLPRSAP